MALKLSSRLASQAQRIRWFGLGVFAAPLMGAFYYGYTHHTSPLICPFRYFTGIPCPGCGMTRSFVAIAQGDLRQAVEHHLLGPVLFAGCLIAIVHIMLELLTRRHLQVRWSQWINRNVQLTGLFIVLSYYGYRLSALLASGELPEAIGRSPLGQFLVAAFPT